MNRGIYVPDAGGYEPLIIFMNDHIKNQKDNKEESLSAGTSP
jgi:hypothetical protein